MQVVSKLLIVAIFFGAFEGKAGPKFNVYENLSSPPKIEAPQVPPSLIKTHYLDADINTCIEKTCGKATENIGWLNAFPKDYERDPVFLNFWNNDLSYEIQKYAILNHESNKAYYERAKI